MIKFSLAIATAVCALFPNVVAAEAASPTRGYQAKLMPSGQVCIRTTASSEVRRLGVPLGQTRCQLPARWAADGLGVELGGTRIN